MRNCRKINSLDILKERKLIFYSVIVLSNPLAMIRTWKKYLTNYYTCNNLYLGRVMILFIANSYYRGLKSALNDPPRFTLNSIGLLHNKDV